MKSILASVLACLMLTSVAIIPAGAAHFSDVPANAWYAKDVNEVQSYGIINGKGPDFSRRRPAAGYPVCSCNGRRSCGNTDFYGLSRCRWKTLYICLISAVISCWNIPEAGRNSPCLFLNLPGPSANWPSENTKQGKKKQPVRSLFIS